MRHGTNGTILRVDLTTGSISTDSFDEGFYRRYPGGKALAAYHLLREFRPGGDPLGPENVLILAAGLLTGAPISTATRFNAIARSPLTGGFGESEAGGYWGPELKMAGLDAIVITGRSPDPVWLWVKDGAAEIRDGRHLWGKDPATVQAAIRGELDDRMVRVLQIGRAGEHAVRFAMLMNELRHYNGRTGMGAVMGSKNLRAIAVRGGRRYTDLAHDPATLGELGRRLAKQVPEHAQAWDLRTKGTPGLTDGQNAGGILPTRNFRQGSFERVDEINLAA
ncbi:MAG: aldehyde ferredoxin oxidoreductase N-terminal domain-containing protein, partial [Solirubrobacterales bacterium]